MVMIWPWKRASQVGLACAAVLTLTGADDPATTRSPQSKATDAPHARVPLLDDAGAWRHLPVAKRGGGQPLPTWARALARALPRTTAAMLELDRLQRTRNPLGPALRGKMRWIVADANRSAYARAYAEADLRRAGISESEIRALGGDHSELPDLERATLAFARRMTLEADQVTDVEVDRLKSAYGEKKLVAMILVLAYANFQDRLLLALDLPLETAGPLPPLEVFFDSDKPAPSVPTRNRLKHGPARPVPQRIDDSDWLALDIDELKRNLDIQKTNLGRIRVPPFEEVRKGLPASYPVPKDPVRIRWTLACMGYQPELAIAWSACTRAFAEEAKQDRVFEESLFWVVTRTIHCFY
jgi:alkylhydroperoxidase family enzyme